jgi:hypothetical protein
MIDRMFDLGSGLKQERQVRRVDKLDKLDKLDKQV